ncbi:MAG: ABC transporter ATP-binding protein [Candidatus Lokiarchaeota archaeon]|nr:ABC transporter ATP-binding protein [Candidatus Lokiarchaeota archaeon]
MNTVFEIQQVSKQYRDLIALDNISLDINQGEILGYIGPNGAGKTTTIKILVGLIKQYQGSVLYQGKNIKTSEISSLLHKELGYLPQEVDFQQWRTVKHALTTFGLLSGIPREILNDSIVSTLKLVGLSDVENKKIVHLSGGMKQKLKLAQALMHNPKFLILDEPMSGLDPSFRYQVKNIIKILHQQGITIFLSSHILSDIENLATRIAIIHQGKIKKIGTPSELSEEFRIGNDIEIMYIKGSPQIRKDDLNCIQSITQESGINHIIHSSPEVETDECIKILLRYILDNGIKIRTLSLREPDLEDVYLHYVREAY